MKKLVLAFKKAVLYLLNGFKKALFVPDIKCIVCNRELKEKNKYCMCESCLKELPYQEKRVCYKCGTEVFGTSSYCLNCKDAQKDYEFARAPFIYEKQIKTLIYRLKYSSGKYLAPYLSLFLLDEFIKQSWEVDLVIPVPLFKDREKKRGFNQAELIACEFQNKLTLPIITGNLVRIKNTPTQTKLTKTERKENLTKAFQVLNKKELKNKNILLIDDVFTTGATADECCLALKKAGAKNIYVLTLAHVKQHIASY